MLLPSAAGSRGNSQERTDSSYVLRLRLVFLVVCLWCPPLSGQETCRLNLLCACMRCGSLACLQEEYRGWDVNVLVFSASMWGTYQALMRADFKLFDQYSYQHQGAILFSSPQRLQHDRTTSATAIARIAFDSLLTFRGALATTTSSCGQNTELSATKSRFSLVKRSGEFSLPSIASRWTL
jgi:hypothetical protein